MVLFGIKVVQPKGYTLRDGKSADTTNGSLRSPKIHHSLTMSTLVCTLKHNATTRERGKPVALCIHVLQKRLLHWGTICVLTATQVKIATMKTRKIPETHSRRLGDSHARTHADPCHHQVQTYTREDDEHIYTDFPSLGFFLWPVHAEHPKSGIFSWDPPMRKTQ